MDIELIEQQIKNLTARINNGLSINPFGTKKRLQHQAQLLKLLEQLYSKMEKLCKLTNEPERFKDWCELEFIDYKESIKKYSS